MLIIAFLLPKFDRIRLITEKLSSFLPAPRGAEHPARPQPRNTPGRRTEGSRTRQAGRGRSRATPRRRSTATRSPQAGAAARAHAPATARGKATQRAKGHGARTDAGAAGGQEDRSPKPRPADRTHPKKARRGPNWTREHSRSEAANP